MTTSSFLWCTCIIATIFNYYFSCGCPAGEMPALKNASETLNQIQLPEGFAIEIFVAGIDHARSLCLSPNDVLYVGTRDGGSASSIVGITAGFCKMSGQS